MSTFLRADLGAISGLMIWLGLSVAIYLVVKATSKERDSYNVNRDLDSAFAMCVIGVVLFIIATALLPVALLLN